MSSVLDVLNDEVNRGIILGEMARAVVPAFPGLARFWSMGSELLWRAALAIDRLASEVYRENWFTAQGHEERRSSARSLAALSKSAERDVEVCFTWGRWGREDCGDNWLTGFVEVMVRDEGILVGHPDLKWPSITTGPSMPHGDPEMLKSYAADLRAVSMRMQVHADRFKAFRRVGRPLDGRSIRNRIFRPLARYADVVKGVSVAELARRMVMEFGSTVDPEMAGERPAAVPAHWPDAARKRREKLVAAWEAREIEKWKRFLSPKRPAAPDDVEVARTKLRENPGVAGVDKLIGLLGFGKARGRAAIRTLEASGEIENRGKGRSRRLHLREPAKSPHPPK